MPSNTQKLIQVLQLKSPSAVIVVKASFEVAAFVWASKQTEKMFYVLAFLAFKI